MVFAFAWIPSAAVGTVSALMLPETAATLADPVLCPSDTALTTRSFGTVVGTVQSRNVRWRCADAAGATVGDEDLTTLGVPPLIVAFCFPFFFAGGLLLARYRASLGTSGPPKR
ncbi:MAG: hypothetical protein HY243_15810 [Proteobacteria bacterium]|nr:hypothetical protein [Pseudomonadota bacterium]